MQANNTERFARSRPCAGQPLHAPAQPGSQAQPALQRLRSGSFARYAGTWRTIARSGQAFGLYLGHGGGYVLVRLVRVR